MAGSVPRSLAFLGQKCHFLRQIGKSKETWRQTMLFVWWAALRLSVHLLTVKERRCDTSERSVITPSIITGIMPQKKKKQPTIRGRGKKKGGRQSSETLT